MSKKKSIKLDCGFEAEQWTTGKTECLRVSIIDLYEGYSTCADFSKYAALFQELADKGYKPYGMSRVVGYYDSLNDLFLDCGREIVNPKTPS